MNWFILCITFILFIHNTVTITVTDEIEIWLAKQRDPNCKWCQPPQYVKTLNDTSTPTFVDQELTFVLFWLNVDTESKLALNKWNAAYKLLSEVLQMKMGSVACHDWPDVCDKYGVTSWPVLSSYKDGNVYKSYNNVWDAKVMGKWIELTNSPSLHIIDTEEQYETLRNQFSTITLLLCTEQDCPEFEAFKEASDTLHGRYSLAFASGEMAEILMRKTQMTDLPVLVTVKSQDDLQPFVVKVVKDDLTSEDVTQFVVRYSRPSLLNADDPQSVPLLLRSKSILFYVGQDEKDIKLFKTILTENSFSDDLIYAVRQKNEKLDESEGFLQFFFYDKIYNFEIRSNDKLKRKEVIIEWINDVLNEKVKPNVNLNDVPRKERKLDLDFKELIYGEKSSNKIDIKITSDHRSKVEL